MQLVIVTISTHLQLLVEENSVYGGRPDSIDAYSSSKTIIENYELSKLEKQNESVAIRSLAVVSFRLLLIT